MTTMKTYYRFSEHRVLTDWLPCVEAELTMLIDETDPLAEGEVPTAFYDETTLRTMRGGTEGLLAWRRQDHRAFDLSLQASDLASAIDEMQILDGRRDMSDADREAIDRDRVAARAERLVDAERLMDLQENGR